MPTFIRETQYPVSVEPIFSGAETVTESKWHQPFSEPVRQKINPQYAIAEIASGVVIPYILPPIFQDKWHYAWNLPVRIKPGLHSSLQQFYMAEPFGMAGHETNIEAKWHFTWSEPIRLSFKRSISIANQKAWFGPDRLLPTPQVIVRMLAIESEDDIALATVNVYNPQPVAVIGVQTRVSISEIMVPMSPTAITESQ